MDVTQGSEGLWDGYKDSGGVASSRLYKEHAAGSMLEDGADLNGHCWTDFKMPILSYAPGRMHGEHSHPCLDIFTTHCRPELEAKWGVGTLEQPLCNNKQ